MKSAARTAELKYDPILDELYCVRDAYAREFKFDVDAICDALVHRRQRTVVPNGNLQEPDTKAKPRGTSRRRVIA